MTGNGKSIPPIRYGDDWEMVQMAWFYPHDSFSGSAFAVYFEITRHRFLGETDAGENGLIFTIL
jgi:hypothetical protein